MTEVGVRQQVAMSIPKSRFDESIGLMVRELGVEYSDNHDQFSGGICYSA